MELVSLKNQITKTGYTFGRFVEDITISKKIIDTGVPFRDLSKASNGYCILQWAITTIYAGTRIDRGMKAFLATVSASIDNECTWTAVREPYGITSDKIIVKWIYDVYGYHLKKNLGNMPPFDRAMTSDPIVYRGAFLIQLTGRANYKATMPTAKRYYGILSRKLSFASTDKIDAFDKATRGGAIASDAIKVLSSDPLANLAIVFAYFNIKLGRLSSFTYGSSQAQIHHIMKKTASSVGYRNTRTVYRKGAVVPSVHDIILKSILLFNSTS